MGKSAKFAKKPLNKRMKNKSDSGNKAGNIPAAAAPAQTASQTSNKRRDRIVKLSNEVKDAKSKGKSVLNDKDYLKVFEK